jgi:Mce-associated membrane protein
MTTLSEGTAVTSTTGDQETADDDATEDAAMSSEIEPTNDDATTTESEVDEVITSTDTNCADEPGDEPGDEQDVDPDDESDLQTHNETKTKTSKETKNETDTETKNQTGNAQKRARPKRPVVWSRVFAFGVLPAIALLLALTAGYLKWLDVAAAEAAHTRTESVRIASEDAVALLSYRPDTVDKDLAAARERLTGDFKDQYTALTRQVVIPGSKEKRIAAVAKVNAASSVSATADHAVVLLFINQTVTIGEGGTPTDTQPVVRVTLEKVDGRWLVSHFDPV